MENLITALQTFSKLNETFKYNDISYILENIEEYLNVIKVKKNEGDHKETIEYYNIPCAFDIETSSFYTKDGNENRKTAIMYEWTFGIMGYVIIGRTWGDFISLLDKITSLLGLHHNHRLIIYVHNLAFEFQFFRKYFTWDNVFALDERKPVYAVTNTGIEFRCSYILSGYSLAKCAENLTMFKIAKLTGDLDYKLIRHTETPLKPDELQYCINDVMIVMMYICECIINDGDIGKIPLTQTGYVRKYCRKNCLTNTDTDKYRRFRYQRLMRGLQITSVEEYKQLKRGFMGGFTHANPFCANKILTDITSYDFTSSYPTVMISEKFPMSTSEQIEIKSMREFNDNLQHYCCLFDVKFEKIEPRMWCENYISESRCTHITGEIINNGRIVCADELITTITEQDFFIIQKFYKWEHMYIGTFRRYKKGYLPKPFIQSILKLYADKTQLKNVDGKEIEYLKSKGMLNSCYGMAVTAIIRDEIEYTDDWNAPTPPDFAAKLNEYNNDPNRFLFFPWGIWVTAYARKNLFTGIYEFNNDYVYSDTDSIKVRNIEKHLKYITDYNDWITSRLKTAMKYHNLPVEMIEPMTINGDKKPLGVWDFDGHYLKFKTLGSKRYLVMYSNDERNGKNIGKINLTVSGLNKKIATPYMLGKYGDTIFENFTDELYIPQGKTGKLTHTYIDTYMSGTVTDYLGNVGKFSELSAVHLSESDYSLKLSKKYIDYLLNIKSETVG